jgi:hypothetical protein
MALTMINPTSSWFEIVELPIVNQLQRQAVNGKELLTANKIFDSVIGRWAYQVQRRKKKK